MEEMVNKMVAETGIDKGAAEKVVDFLKNHAAEIPQWLGKAGVNLPGNLGEGLGGFFK